MIACVFQKFDLMINLKTCKLNKTNVTTDLAALCLVICFVRESKVKNIIQCFYLMRGPVFYKPRTECFPSTVQSSLVRVLQHALND